MPRKIDWCKVCKWHCKDVPDFEKAICTKFQCDL